VKRLLRYINPIAHLGDGHYSIAFPLIANLLLCIFSEAYAYGIAKDPMVVGVYIIFLNVFFILYFAFRDGLRGGFISSAISILYYFYIIYTRHYTGQQFTSGIRTTIVLALLYFLIAFIIGWLKLRIDQLIEQEANEKIRLQTILQQLPVGVVVTDNNGRVTQANKQLGHIFGVKVPIGYGVSKNKSLLQSMGINADSEASQSTLYQVLKTGKQITGKEYAIQRKDGKMVQIQVSSSAIKDKKQRVIAAASIVNDVSVQKELERQKDDFLSMASHELKTPITSLKMFVELQSIQLKRKDPKKAKYFNDRISDQADRLKELTSDLLDVSRIQTGKLRFVMEKFDITGVIRDTVEGLADTSKKHEIIFKNGKKILVKGDKYRIYQVLVNLITNAIKYSHGEEMIIVQVKLVKRNVVVSIEDFGIGIEKDQQRKIFDRLYQVSGSEEKTFPGLGLGLFISKEIIQRHRGRIWVESEKGKGSTFFFSLPVYTGKA
jgi:two-component system, OmpR family, phosphate regulon sensor histidine kinase PhoR